MKNENFEFRRAVDADIAQISALSKKENLIYRPPEEVEVLLPYYHVAVTDGGEVIGCISAKKYGADAEIISFRVQDDFSGCGIGLALLRTQLEFLSSRNIAHIFALTTQGVFEKVFKKADFIEVGIQLFGPKVILECARCPKNIFEGGKHLCDEIAVLLVTGVNTSSKRI